jgi:glycosyltransferase involved in cell wall biosynthesis
MPPPAEWRAGQSPLTFVDAVESSRSLRIMGFAVHRTLQRHFDSVDLVTAGYDANRLALWRRVPTIRSPRPGRAVVLSYLANHLGRAVHLVPALAADRLRVLYVGWELEQLTTELTAELKGADVILGMSPYISQVYRRSLPETPVVTATVVPDMPETTVPDRGRFGLPSDKVLVLYVFDPASGFDRKNPADVHRAFEMAFPGRDDVRLVFKVHGKLTGSGEATGVAAEAGRAAEFLDLVASDPRVVLINEDMSYADVMALVASCGAFVSLARAEGIGLPVLEAMTLGVPTVCTAYSGHLDFTTSDSALLVPVTLADIPADASYHYQSEKYDETPQWAVPDLDVAANHLRMLADDPHARNVWGELGKRRAAQYREQCASGSWVSELLRALDSEPVRTNHTARNDAFRAASLPQAAEWAAHDGRVRRARMILAIRTRLGRLKRTARRFMTR